MDIEQLKHDICDIGRRIYQRGFAAANDGNITVRLDDQRLLCTPTMPCKGFLQPDDIATVDMSGRQLEGKKPRSSEALLHIEVYRRRPDVRAVVHCHPPHATAFAVARQPIPQCVLPEFEVFLGEVPIAPYETPGGKAFAETIAPFVEHTSVIVLANHGTVSFGETVERAYWWTEILDAYCRILLLARQLGDIRYLTHDQTRALLELKRQWGFRDPRNLHENRDCDICGNAIFRHTWAQAGIRPQAFAAGVAISPAEKPPHPPVESGHAPLSQGDIERIAELVSSRILSALQADRVHPPH